jgi:hypothetical protein
VLFKLDHNINQAHRLSGSLFYTTGLDSVGLLGNIPWVTRDFSWRQYNYNVAETWIVSPTMINQATLTYVRNFGGRVNTPAVSLGDLGSLYRIQGAPSLPQISVAGRFNLTSAIPGPVAGSNQYQFRDVFSISSAKHSLRLGGEAVLEKMVHDTLLNNYGTFSFTTSKPRGSKNATADFSVGPAGHDEPGRAHHQDQQRLVLRLLPARRLPRHQTPDAQPGRALGHSNPDHRSARPLPHLCQRRAIQDCPGGASRTAFPG